MPAEECNMFNSTLDYHCFGQAVKIRIFVILYMWARTTIPAIYCVSQSVCRRRDRGHVYVYRGWIIEYQHFLWGPLVLSTSHPQSISPSFYQPQLRRCIISYPFLPRKSSVCYICT